MIAGLPALDRRLRRLPEADAMDAPALGFEHFDDQAVELERLADRRDAPGTGEDVASDGFKPVRLDLDVEPLAHLVDVDLGAEDV